MTDRSDMDMDLETHFEAARGAAPLPSAALLERVMADAERMHRPARPVRPAPRRHPMRVLFDTLGGWPAMAGFATAAVAGVWIGLGPSDALLRGTGIAPGAEDTAYLVDMSPEMMFALTEDAQ